MKLLLSISIFSFLFLGDSYWGIDFKKKTTVENNIANPVYLSGKIKDYYSRKPIPDSAVLIICGDDTIQTIYCKKNGRWKYTLEHGRTYSIVFTAIDHISKRMEINCHGIPEDDKSGYSTITIPTSLFRRIDGLDYSLFNEAIGKATFDMKNLNFVFDSEYSDTMELKFSEFMLLYEAALNE